MNNDSSVFYNSVNPMGYIWYSKIIFGVDERRPKYGIRKDNISLI